MRRRIVGFIAALLAAVMTFGSAEALAGVKDVNGAPVYVAEDSDNILGMATDFAVFAKTVNLTGHIAGNVACKKLTYVNNMDATAYGTYYAQEFNPGRDIGAISTYGDFGTVKELHIYVGSNYTFKQEDDGSWYIFDGERQVNSDKIQKGGCADTIVFHNESKDTLFIDIDSEMDKLVVKSANIAGYENTVDSKDKELTQEGKRLQVNFNTGNNVLNISYDELFGTNAQGLKVTDFFINGIANTDNTLVINVYGIPENTTEISTPRIKFYVNGAEKSPEDCYKDTSRILWNFGSFSGTIDIADIWGGTILAPQAKVKVRGTLVGGVIAEEFLASDNEIHFIPYKVKKQPTKVAVSIQTVDGTCCDRDENGNPVSYRLLPGVDVALYKKTGSKYKKVSKSIKTNSDATASWTIDKTGDYCIKVLSAPDGFVKTPIKCLFTVEEDDAGILRITPVKGKEGNGQSNTGKASADNTSASFRIRFYSDSIYMAAYDGTDGSLVKLEDGSFVVSDSLGSSVKAEQAQGLQDDEGTPYEMKESHITKPGKYTVQLLGETKDIDIYLLPSGLYLPVEYDGSGIAETIFSNFGKYELTKIKSAQQKQINDYMKSHEELFDGCLFFEVNQVEQVAVNE